MVAVPELRGGRGGGGGGGRQVALQISYWLKIDFRVFLFIDCCLKSMSWQGWIRVDAAGVGSRGRWMDDLSHSYRLRFEYNRIMEPISDCFYMRPCTPAPSFTATSTLTPPPTPTHSPAILNVSI